MTGSAVEQDAGEVQLPVDNIAKNRFSVLSNIPRSKFAQRALFAATVGFGVLAGANHLSPQNPGVTPVLADKPVNGPDGVFGYLVDDTEFINHEVNRVGAERLANRNSSLMLADAVDPAAIETRNLNGYTLTKIMGDWNSDAEIKVMFVPISFTDSADFQRTVVTATNDLFNMEPFSSHRSNFGIYALDPSTTPSDLQCDLTTFQICDSKAVKKMIDNVRLATRMNLVETFFIFNDDRIGGVSFLDPFDDQASIYSYGTETKGSVLKSPPSIVQEFEHSFARITDEYWETNKSYINCQPADANGTIVKWSLIPGQPGTKYPGCSSPDWTGYGDDPNDIMLIYDKPYHLGVVDIWQTIKRIQLGNALFGPLGKWKVYTPAIMDFFRIPLR